MSGLKRQSFSLDKKAEIIKAVNSAPSSKKKKEIAADFGILVNTLSTILKNRDSIKECDFKQRAPGCQGGTLQMVQGSPRQKYSCCRTLATYWLQNRNSLLICSVRMISNLAQAG